MAAISALTISCPAAKQSLLRAGLPHTLTQLLRKPHTLQQSHLVLNSVVLIIHLMASTDSQQEMLSEITQDHAMALFKQLLALLEGAGPLGRINPKAISIGTLTTWS